MTSLIAMYTGRRGKGKTLSMVLDAYNYYLNGWKIYTNMDSLAFPCEIIENEDLLDMADRDEFRNCIIVIDEIQVLLDSRRSQRKENTQFLYFIQQIRKRNVILLCTTQFSKRVDVGIREHLDYEVRPNFIQYKDYDKSVCEVTYIDLTSQEENGFLEYFIKVYVADDVFDLYDHKERAERIKRNDDDYEEPSKSRELDSNDSKQNKQVLV